MGRGQRGRGLETNKSNSLKIEGLYDICLSLFFRVMVLWISNFSRYYTKYTIKIKPPRMSVDLSHCENLLLKKHKERNQFYYFSNILYCSEACSNNHFYKTITRLKRPMLSPRKQIFIQPLFYKKTTCLTWPVTTFLVSKWKKTYIKLPLQTFTQRRKQT